MRAQLGPNRRVLLAAGGLTLLAGCATPATSAAQELHASAGTRSAAPRLAGTHQVGTSRPDTSPPGTASRSGDHRSRHKGTITGTDRPVYYIHDGPKAIALTIDDGPSPVYTPQILRLLRKYRVTASFSMVGVQVDQYPALAREVAAAGHEIMNHTW